MYLSHIIRRERCDVTVDPPLLQSKYTCFDKHTLGHMHYVMDIYGNYVKNLRRAPKHFEPEVHDELERQPEEAPAQGPSAPPLLALPDTQSVILDELIHLRQIMMSHFDQMDRKISDLESTTDAILITIDALQAAQLPPPSSF